MSTYEAALIQQERLKMAERLTRYYEMLIHAAEAGRLDLMERMNDAMDKYLHAYDAWEKEIL